MDQAALDAMRQHHRRSAPRMSRPAPIPWLAAGVALGMVAAPVAEAGRKPTPTPAEVAAAPLRRAAEAGDPEAQVTLAAMYQRGVSLPKDEYLAYVWAQAALLGARFKDDAPSRGVVLRAQAICDEVAPRLSPDQEIQAHAQASAAVEDVLFGDRW
jgi:hypothetical protein